MFAGLCILDDNGCEQNGRVESAIERDIKIQTVKGSVLFEATLRS
jgi:hypothetical protein